MNVAFFSLKEYPNRRWVYETNKKLFTINGRHIIKNHGEYYCYGCFHSFRCKTTLRKHEELCKYHKHCIVTLVLKVKTTNATNLEQNH